MKTKCRINIAHFCHVHFEYVVIRPSWPHACWITHIFHGANTRKRDSLFNYFNCTGKKKRKKSPPNDIVTGNIREFWIWGGERLRVRDLTYSFCACSKQKDNPEIFILLFFTKKLVRLFIMKEVEQNDKTVLHLITCSRQQLRHFSALKLGVEWRRLSRFPANLTLGHGVSNTRYWENVVFVSEAKARRG